MPLFGVDVSRFQGQVNWKQFRQADIAFAFAKATEGGDFTDSRWARNRKKMLALGDGFLPGAYHFLRKSDVERQVRHFLDTTEDLSKLAVALDVEATAGGKEEVGLSHARAWVREFKRRTNGHPVIGYLPKWYWKRIGGGDLKFFDTLWASHYVSGKGSPSELYGKIDSDWWASYGDETVSILQFSSTGEVAGESPIDLNAYRGDLAELRDTALGR